jgi:glycosyltransferase involved in cell wall biosynthesis
MHPIPIVLLHHNEFDFLRRTLHSIKKNTDYSHEIIIIDNNSPRNESFWNELSVYDCTLKVIFNKRNNWIYGFNLAKKYFCNEYIILSDADIVVPSRVNGVCWLTHLVSQMNQHQVIGKLGLSIDLSMIRDVTSLNRLYMTEKKFKSGVLIGENVVAPVDSTLAIYRTNIFITAFKMRIGHMRLIKPYMYCARTSDLYQCEHIGWEKYLMHKENLNESNDALIRKAEFFARFGISFPVDLMSRLSLIHRFNYWLVFGLVRGFHSVKIFYLWTVYFFNRKNA